MSYRWSVRLAHIPFSCALTSARCLTASRHFVAGFHGRMTMKTSLCALVLHQRWLTPLLRRLKKPCFTGKCETPERLIIGQRQSKNAAFFKVVCSKLLAIRLLFEGNASLDCERSSSLCRRTLIICQVLFCVSRTIFLAGCADSEYLLSSSTIRGLLCQQRVCLNSSSIRRLLRQ